MSLRKQIDQDIKKALKAGNQETLEVLRFLMAQIKDQEIEQEKRQLNDEQVVKVISKLIKEQKQSQVLFKKGGRDELVKRSKLEIKTLRRYLPEQLSDQEIEKKVDEVIAANPNLDQPGPLIGLCVKALQGQADNKKVAQMVMKKLKQSG